MTPLETTVNSFREESPMLNSFSRSCRTSGGLFHLSGLAAFSLFEVIFPGMEQPKYNHFWLTAHDL